MKHLTSIAVVLACLCLGAPGACDRAPDPKAAATEAAPAAAALPAQVVTTFYPTRYFAQRIAGGLVTVECPLPADADAIFWQPDARAVARFQRAELIVINGADFERWVATASLPLSRICDSARPLSDEFVKFEKTTHSHGAAGTHAHEGIDGHTWMDPNNAMRQAEQIMLAMARRWPQHERAFRDNFRVLHDDLNDLDSRIRGLKADTAGVQVLASHPAYNYLARRYGWKITNMDLPPDQPPAPEQLTALRRTLRAPTGGRAIILFESDPAPEVLTALREFASLTPVTFEPAENISPDRLGAGEDYLSIMRGSIERFAAALRPHAPAPPAAAASSP